MDRLLSTIKIQVNPKIYVKDPETSALGRRIINQSVVLIDQMGFDHFTFKKLGERIGSNESSIYRYFENKHKLLLYLSSWYWGWIEYRLVFSTANLTDAVERLRVGIRVVTEKVQDDLTTEHINESILNRIIIAEFTKSLQTKEVDDENKEGFFMIYKRVIQRVSELALAVNPEYPYVKSLISTVVEGSLHQHFLADHLKTITSVNETVSVTDFYLNLIEQLLENKAK
jgi:AcrR family transcriptional regulator